MSADQDVWTPRMAPDAEQSPPPVEVRVRFGPLDHQWITADLASMLLTLWRDKQPGQFGAYLAEAFTGTRPAAGRGRKP